MKRVISILLIVSAGVLLVALGLQSWSIKEEEKNKKSDSLAKARETKSLKTDLTNEIKVFDPSFVRLGESVEELREILSNHLSKKDGSKKEELDGKID